MKNANINQPDGPQIPQSHGVAFSEVKKAQADLAYNANKAAEAHRDAVRALRLQIQDQRPALASGIWS